MTLDDLRELYATMPDGAAVSLTREALGRLLESLGESEGAALTSGDLTLAQAAERVGRAVSTVRGWCSSGQLPGAYKFNGRDWRIPPARLNAFLCEQREGRRRHRASTGVRHDLTAWRSGGIGDAQ